MTTADDKTEALLEDLRKKGFRITHQRETIMRIFQEEASKHLSAEDVFEVLRKNNEQISLATTYRTLRILVEMNILRELDFAESHKHYELVEDGHSPHHHIICLNCNKTIEFENDAINKLGEKIAKQYGLEIIDLQFQILAKCPKEHEDNKSKHRK
jgi:Fur family transcriptional regulator, ferric uptake regulator